jgi:hypothetical protein
MNLQILQTLLSDAKTGQWLALTLMLILLARKWCSNTSNFPVTVSPAWQHVVSAGLGLAGGVVSALQAHLPWTQVVFAGVSAGVAAGFFDGLLTAVFATSSAPAWAKWLVLAVDDLGQEPPGSAQYNKSANTLSPPSAQPPAHSRGLTRRRLGRVGSGVLVLGATILSGITTTQCIPQSILTVAGTLASAIAAFLGEAENLWAILVPSIPNGQALTPQFDALVAKAQIALSVFEDALAADNAAQNGNLPALETAAKQAVDDLWNFLESLQSANSSAFAASPLQGRLSGVKALHDSVMRMPIRTAK